MKTITADQLHSIRREGRDLILIDVCSPAEFRAAHVHTAVNLPLGDLDAASIALHANREDEIYLICHSGGRSAKASERLKSLGYTNVSCIDGGTEACRDCGLALDQGKQTISIQRQVRIVAGSLVVLGGMLSFIINPAFIYLSVFVGAGLVYAGISDTCMMGILLTKMPWNR